MALDFKDFLAAYDPAKGDPYIQYRRQKYRRTDTTSESVEQVDEKRGLWDNIWARRRAGKKPHPPGHPDRPTAQDFKNSQTNEAMYHVSWGPKAMTHQVKASSPEEAHKKAKANILAKIPKLGDAKYADAWAKKPTIHNISEDLEQVAEAGTFSYGMKKPRKGSSAWNAIQMGKKDKTSLIEPKDQKVGVAKVTRESVQIDEISQGMKNRYVARASSDASMAAFQKRVADGKAKKDAENIHRKRTSGLNMALKNEEVEVDEALNIQQRRQRMMQFKRQKARIEIGAERARKRVASKEVLMKRARRAARNMLLKKMAKVNSKSELDFARREQIEKRLDKMKNKINVLAVKLFPQLRKMDMERKQAKRNDSGTETK